MYSINVFTQHYPINTPVLNINGRLGLVGLLNLLQDISVMHPETFGQGYKTCLSEGYFWVLSQQKLKMKRWPVWHERLTIKTWIREIGSISANRECALFVGEELIGECAMLLIRMDAQTRRPKRISDTSVVRIAETGKLLGFKAEKITLPENLALASQHTVQISDLDFNQHVNNTKYAEWLLNSLPITLHREFVITSYEVNFLSETLLGNTVRCYSDLTTVTTQNIAKPPTLHAYGKRDSDGKILFTARITANTR